MEGEGRKRGEGQEGQERGQEAALTLHKPCGGGQGGGGKGAGFCPNRGRHHFSLLACPLLPQSFSKASTNN